MSRDKEGDPRALARRSLGNDDPSAAQVWALIHQGDAIHRLAKALEAGQDEDELARRRHGHAA